MNLMTQLLRFTLLNKDSITTIFAFDETSGNVRGVEIYLNKGGTMALTEECADVRLNMFRLREDRYVYLVVGREQDYLKWLTETYEGHICTKVCRQFNYFDSLPRPSDEKVAEYRLQAEAEIKEQYPEAAKALNK